MERDTESRDRLDPVSIETRIRYTVYGIWYTVYVIQIVGGVVQRKPRQGSGAQQRDPLYSLDFARSPCPPCFATENIHGRRSCHREACAVFYLQAFRIARARLGWPFGRLLRVLEPGRGKREAYSTASAKITSQRCPLKCHYTFLPPASSTLSTLSFSFPPGFRGAGPKGDRIDLEDVDSNDVIGLLARLRKRRGSVCLNAFETNCNSANNHANATATRSFSRVSGR